MDCMPHEGFVESISVSVAGLYVDNLEMQHLDDAFVMVR